MKTLTVVSDEDSNEQLYVDGKLWTDFMGGATVYACDIAAAAGDQPFLFRFQSIDGYHIEWPDTLEEALKPPFPQPLPPAKDSDAPQS